MVDNNQHRATSQRQFYKGSILNTRWEVTMAQVLEAEKLLLTLYSANKLGMPVSTETINPYVYLLRNTYKVPLYYSFRFNPLPYSDELMNDLESLKRGGNIEYKSPIVMTDKGIERIEARMSKLRDISGNIEEALKEMSKWDDKSLFQAVYNTITR